VRQPAAAAVGAATVIASASGAMTDFNKWHPLLAPDANRVRRFDVET